MSRDRVAAVLAVGMTLALAGTSVTGGIAGAGDGHGDGDRPGRRRGKVVRVERSRLDGVGTPRLCTNPRPDGGASCYGRPPAVGEVGMVVDENGVRASVRVQEVKPVHDQCGNVNSWEVTTLVRSGDVAQVTMSGAMLFDWAATAKSRTMLPGYYGQAQIPIPGGRQHETLMGAIDDDGDDRADLIVTWYSCDSLGNVTQYSRGGHYCVVHYARDGAGYQQLRIDVVRNCFP
jgi:hypothetical protein